MKNLILLLSIFIFGSCNLVVVNKKTLAKKLDSVMKYQMEEVYYEGQIDALNNDIRITKVYSNCYIWNKSPWDKGTKPYFNPECK